MICDGYTVLKDTEKDQLYVRFAFRQYSDAVLTAVLADLICFDVWGNETERLEGAQFLDLHANRMTPFGQTAPALLQNANSRDIRLTVRSVICAGGDRTDCSDAGEPLPAAEPLAERLGGGDLTAQYRRDTVEKAAFAPDERQTLRRCCCGAYYDAARPKCPDCGVSFERACSLLDPAVLGDRLSAYKAELAEKERQRLAQEEETQRLSEELAKQESEEQERAQSDKRKKKRKKTIVIVSVALVLFTLGMMFFGVPFFWYQSAKISLKKGNYAVAYDTFIKLGVFLNSEEMANETLYQKAGSMITKSQYIEAVDLYKNLDGYKDSEEKLLEAKYLRAEQCQKNKEYEEAYKLYVELGDYKRSRDEVQSTVLLWESAALGASTTEEAVAFSKTVKLTTGHYEAFYSVIMLFLTGHGNADYWYDWGGTTASRNVRIMLKMLPSYYQDTGTLLNLFDLLTEDGGHYYADLFRKNQTLMRQCWSFAFVRDLAEQDDAICFFLEGYWTTYSSYYYIKFYETEDGGTSTQYNLPWIAKPYGTKYYDIQSLEYVYTDENSKELARVYRFEIVDYDTIRVYCYKDNNTYILYR